jgi:hypothetical protein
MFSKTYILALVWTNHFTANKRKISPQSGDKFPLRELILHDVAP